jgi:cadherin 23
VTVYIRDRNDNTPEFSKNRYEVEIPEDVKPGTTVAWVRAADEDSGLFGSEGIRYTRISGPMAGYLHLDERTGK